MEKIKKAIEKFIEGDNHIFLSEEIGYKNDFNSKDVFLCKPEIFIIIKQEHNGLEVNKTLGRKLNKMSCKALKHKKSIAYAEISEAAVLFSSLISYVQENGTWQTVTDAVSIETY